MCKDGKKELKYITDGLSLAVNDFMSLDPMLRDPHDSSCLVWPGKVSNRVYTRRVYARGGSCFFYFAVSHRGIGDRDARLGLSGDDPTHTTGNG
jgi:hypothetical protein